VHFQPNAGTPGRVALYVPEGSAAAAMIISPDVGASGLTTGSIDPGLFPVTRYMAMPGVERHGVKLGVSKGRFAALSLRIQEGAVVLNAVRVVYNTGEVQTVPFGRPLGAGDRTPAFTLERDTFINEIQFLMAPLVSARAVIDVFGTYAEGWSGETGEAKTYTAGWVMLGIRRPTREHLAQASVPEDPRIAPDLGRFKKLRFVARDGAMSVGVVTVLYDDGERALLQVGQMLARDQVSQPVTIEDGGRGRGIVAVSLPPVSKRGARLDGFVEVWGQN
jgi:hypothetical protein